MKSKALVICGLMVLICLNPVNAAEDLSSFGDPVEKTGPAGPAWQSNEPANKLWPAYVCTEIQRLEKVVISGARPSDRGTTRIGLLMLEQLHCGIDVSKKIAADQAVLDEEQRKARLGYEENFAAAQSSASRPEERIIVQVPQTAPESTAPALPATLHCYTNRFGGGISTTTCR